MSANVEVIGPGKFMGWCDEHAEGRQSHRRVVAEDWVLNHNADKHEEQS